MAGRVFRLVAAGSESAKDCRLLLGNDRIESKERVRLTSPRVPNMLLTTAKGQPRDPWP